MHVPLLKRVATVMFSAALMTGVAGAVEMESSVTAIEGGALRVDTISASAIIKAIDAKTREITFEKADGETDVFTAGPEVRNFDQLAVGDKVNVKLTEAAAIYLGKDAAPSADAGAAMARAEIGATPGGAVMGAAQVTAIVTELNVEKRKATLKLSDGKIRRINVREGIDLTKVKVGDSVTIAIVQGIAIDVEKPQAAE